jgi:hypothetical protein
LKLNNRHAVINMVIDGEKNIPFSATTIQLPAPEHDNTAAIVANTRSSYATHRDQVEKDILVWTLGEQAAKEVASSTTQGTGDEAKKLLSALDEQKPNILRNLKNPVRVQANSGSHNASHNNERRNKSRQNSRQNDRADQRPRRPQTERQSHEGPVRRPEREEATTQPSQSLRQPEREKASVGAAVAPASPRNYVVGQPGQTIQPGEAVSLRPKRNHED